MERLSLKEESSLLLTLHGFQRHYIVRQGWRKGHSYQMPTLRPAFLPYQEEKMCGLRIRRDLEDPKLQLAEQESQPDPDRLIQQTIRAFLSWKKLMVDIKCPRCARNMRRLWRLKVYFCDNDGYIVRETDPYVTSGEMVPPYNPGGSYNH